MPFLWEKWSTKLKTKLYSISAKTSQRYAKILPVVDLFFFYFFFAYSLRWTCSFLPYSCSSRFSFWFGHGCRVFIYFSPRGGVVNLNFILMILICTLLHLTGTSKKRWKKAKSNDKSNAQVFMMREKRW